MSGLLLTSLVALLCLVVVTPLITKLCGRQSGWLLGAAYVGISAALLPASAQALHGRTTSATLSWVPSFGVQLSFRFDGISLVFAHIALQVILNICVVINVIPTTGITLPFVSYGGTSVLFLMVEMGIALSVSRKIKFQDKIEG